MSEDIHDVTLRWRSLGLLGGAPKARDVDKAKGVDNMNKAELMLYAKNIPGVETRRVGPGGKKNLHRAVPDVKQDCKAAQSRLCQASQENQASGADAEASSNSRPALPHGQKRADSAQLG